MEKYSQVVVVYDMREKTIHTVSMEQIPLYAKNSLLINFNESDERLFIQAGIQTISIQTFLSVCCGYAVKQEETNRIFRYTTGIHYANVFCNKKVDFSALYESLRFWMKVEKLICDGMELLNESGKQELLKLEVRLTPVLHRMFDGGYPVDVKRAKLEYKRLQNVLYDINWKMRSGNSTEALLHLHKKTEDKILRIPYEVIHTQKSRAVIYCNFRSVGTDTFRITTNHTNVQGLPKAIRKCFLPRHENMLVEYDMVSSQIIILACMSGENLLLQQYAKGVDLYTYIVSKLQKRPMASITAEERGIYKRIILQLLYGAGISAMQKELKSCGIGLSRVEVKEMRERFYKAFPVIKQYSDKVKTADSIELPLGRRFKMCASVEPYKRLAYLLQYVESMILREVLLLLDKEREKGKIWLYLSIHDSVFVETDGKGYANTEAIVMKCFYKAVRAYLPQLNKIKLKKEVIHHDK